MSDQKGYYARLGVPPTATFEEIRDKYRRLAKELHPDRASGDAERMRDINEAWNVLSNPEQRAAYDASTRTGAEVMLRSFFQQYIDRGSDDDDPIRIIRDSIAKGISEKQMEIIADRQKLRSLSRRSKALRYKRPDKTKDIFSVMIESRIRDMEESIKYKEQFIATAEYCRTLIDEYEFTGTSSNWVRI